MAFAPEVDPNQEIGWILCVILSGSQLGNRVDPLVGNWVAPISGNFAVITYDMDLFDDLLEKKSRNFQELADIIRVVRPETGDLGKEWYTRYFEYDDVGEKTYSDTFIGYEKPCRIAPSFDPIVAFEVRKVKEGKY